MPNRDTVTSLRARSTRKSIAQVKRPAPGMASVVSARSRLGSRPETNVSEQSVWAMKPVAILGTLRARAAPRARPAQAMAVAARMILRRRVTGFLRLRANGGEGAGRGRNVLAGFEIRPRRN